MEIVNKKSPKAIEIVCACGYDSRLPVLTDESLVFIGRSDATTHTNMALIFHGKKGQGK